MLVIVGFKKTTYFNTLSWMSEMQQWFWNGLICERFSWDAYQLILCTESWDMLGCKWSTWYILHLFAGKNHFCKCKAFQAFKWHSHILQLWCNWCTKRMRICHNYWVQKGFSIPKSVKFSQWILKSRRKQLHSWRSWVVIAQVQLHQMWWIRAESCRQRHTSFICDHTTWEPTNVEDFLHYKWIFWRTKGSISDTKTYYQMHNRVFMCPNLSVSSVQFGFSSAEESSLPPESCRSLLLRSSSLRREDSELRTVARASQLLCCRLQSLSLKTSAKKSQPSKKITSSINKTLIHCVNIQNILKEQFVSELRKSKKHFKNSYIVKNS